MSPSACQTQSRLESGVVVLKSFVMGIAWSHCCLAAWGLVSLGLHGGLGPGFFFFGGLEPLLPGGLGPGVMCCLSRVSCMSGGLGPGI